MLVWAGVSPGGKTLLHFTERGSSINSRYYIDEMLKSFIGFDIPRLFPGHERKKLDFHQDSAPGHAKKHTIAFLKDQNRSCDTLRVVAEEPGCSTDGLCYF